MTPEDLKTKIESRYGEKIDYADLHKKEWHIDPTTGQTWKSHLQGLFKESLKRNDLPHNMDREIEAFLAMLENLTEGSSLYTFSASSNEDYYSGWAIDSEIAFCMNIKKSDWEPDLSL